MQLINVIYQANDLLVFQGATAEEDCRQHEMEIALAPHRSLLDKIGYKAVSVEDAYKEIYPRRRRGTIHMAVVHDILEYEIMLEYVSKMNGEPREIEDMKKLRLTFPCNLRILVYNGIKRPHAVFLQGEIAAGIAKHADLEIELAPLFEQEKKKRNKKTGTKSPKHNVPGRLWISDDPLGPIPC